ncbi:GxxExxY protein [Rhodohalobacter barkolensis]|uniref:GxxExxY protein n=1 Tax=Rhodohalobacter barkolensis TaxID=2053187 RepID=A0A2N0VH45_9BACT|nr:GxxExxY protein [Rhodohalobacter barkolensis]PKD43511.1 GxxExxY protein [Rhodohalobacter barkolensis]
MDHLKHKELTGRIIGACMRVHSELGNGFPEVIYQRSLAIEFSHSNLEYDREISMALYYQGQNVGSRRVDFLVEDKILLELKAVSEITSVHYAQILNYLKAYQLQIGLLVNFGEESLKFKRFINSKFE